ncbi:MAG: tetratricopeptide repeat protein [Planctomycetota bacterium]|jgi:tetratricopeptide (TPR) repeat protein
MATSRGAILILLAALAACGTTPEKAETIKTGQMPVTAKDVTALKYFESGRTKADRLHFKEAERDFRFAIDRDPDFALAWLWLSQSVGSMEEGNKCRAQAVALKGKASQGEQLLIEASQAEFEGKIEEARRLRARLVSMYPKDARCHLVESLGYFRIDDRRCAQGLEKAVELDPYLDTAWNLLGYSYMSLGEMDKAVQAHATYVKLLPDEPNAHDSYAETLLKAGRFEESISEYEKALALDESFFWSRVGIGKNLLVMRRYDEANEEFDRAIREAKTASNRYQAAQWQITRAIYAGDGEAAVSAAERAVELAERVGKQEHAYATLTVARAELFADKREECVATASHAMALMPEDAPRASRRDLTQSILRLKIEASVTARRFEAAESLLEQLRSSAAVGSPPWVAQLVQFTVGYYWLHRGEAESALEALEKANHSDPRVLYYLAEAKRRVGEVEEANEIYTRIVSWNEPGLGHALVLDLAKKRLGR